MGNYTISRCLKIPGEAGKQEILQQTYFPKIDVERCAIYFVLKTQDLFDKDLILSEWTCPKPHPRETGNWDPKIQSNRIDLDNKRAIESVRISGVSI